MLRDLPLEVGLAENRQPAILLEAADGSPLGRVGPLKIDAPLDDIPDHLVAAVLSIEDRSFYDHIGIDPRGIGRALRQNMAAGAIVEGGSTITQQLVKLSLVGNDRTLTRKLREAVAAVWLETRLSKDEILARYLNTVYLGAGAYGMAAAARMYFDKEVSALSLSESALLAGMIRAPSQYNPLRNLDAARTRAATVLDAMVANGVIDRPTAENAKAEPIVLKRPALTSEASTWFADWAAEEAVAITGPFAGRMRVRTTLIPELQALAEKVITEGLAKEGAKLGASQAALVALRPDGSVVAMVGGRDYAESKFNRAVQAQRQPGSAFKMFVYLAALRNGFSPHDTIEAGPFEINGWRPENFANRSYGRITLADAFAQSINTAAARLALDVGLDQVIATARDLGVRTQLPKLPSLALGAVEMNLLELTSAFAAVRTGRAPMVPWGIAAFAPEERERLVSTGPPIEPQNSIEPQRAAMTEMLRLVVERGTGRRAALGGFTAGKTGTSQNHRDAWFIGFNDALVVGVWVGNDDGSPMKAVTGGTLPAQLWNSFTAQATKRIGAPAPPHLIAHPDEPAAPGAAIPASAGAGQAAPAQCDVRACAARYNSFRADDCTYQPYRGPRALCELKPRGDQSAATPAAQQASSQPGGEQCNVEVCAEFYRSFRASDCTYQPESGGPRQICTR